MTVMFQRNLCFRGTSLLPHIEDRFFHFHNYLFMLVLCLALPMVSVIRQKRTSHIHGHGHGLVICALNEFDGTW